MRYVVQQVVRRRSKRRFALLLHYKWISFKRSIDDTVYRTICIGRNLENCSFYDIDSLVQSDLRNTIYADYNARVAEHPVL